MDANLRLSFRKGDLLAIALVVLLAVGVFAACLPEKESGAGALLVYQDGRLLDELPLDRDAELTVGGDYTNRIEIKGGCAAIVESDCPGTDCVHSGWISAPGRSIACLPNRVEVRIGGLSDVDFVVG